jgi:hypothetical protein
MLHCIYCRLIDWFAIGFRTSRSQCTWALIYGPFVPHIDLWEPFSLLKFQVAPRLVLLMSSGSKEEEPRYTCLCEAKVSHSQRMWEEVSSCAPHLLHSGVSDSPIRWRYLLRVLCPVRRPVTAMDWVLVKNRNLALAPRQGPEINSWACLWVSPKPYVVDTVLSVVCINTVRTDK